MPESSRRPNILYVDDDDDLRLCVEAALAHAGYEVTTAGGADDGIAALRDGRYDLLLTDEWMPGETGTEMIERARSLGVLDRTRTSIVTNDEDLLGSRSDLCAKPLDAAALVRHVGDMLAAAAPVDAAAAPVDAAAAPVDAAASHRRRLRARRALQPRQVLAAMALAVGLVFASLATMSASQRVRPAVDVLRAAGT